MPITKNREWIKTADTLIGCLLTLTMLTVLIICAYSAWVGNEHMAYRLTTMAIVPTMAMSIVWHVHEEYTEWQRKNQ